MPSSQLVTYSLIKALYDEGKDYIDSFWPFVVQALPMDGRRVGVSPLADEVRTRFQLSIPIQTVRTLAERARRAHSFVDRVGDSYFLTAKGKDYVNSAETERQVERRLAALIDHAFNHLTARGGEFADREAVRVAVLAVIKDHARVFDFVGVEKPAAPDGGYPLSRVQDRQIFEYFADIENREPAHFETLRDLILGSVIVGLLKREKLESNPAKFEATTLFLDSNFLLSLLQFRFPVQCRPALELLGLLQKTSRFRLKVFDFTLTEVVSLLKGYREHENDFIAGVLVDDLYSSMRTRGMRPSDVTERTAQLRSELLGIGIVIETTGITVDSLPEDFAGRSVAMHAFKPDQDERGQKHDLHAISQVARRRREKATQIERAGFFFLTEDQRLSSYASETGGHSASKTIPEVMPDRLLTNLLWLSDPGALGEFDVATVIAMHSRNLFIESGVWRSFRNQLTSIVASGDLAEERAGILLYDAQVHSDLACLRPEQAKSIDRDWVLKRAEGAVSRKENEVRDREAMVARGFEKAIAVEREARSQAEARAGVAESRRLAQLARWQASERKSALTQAKSLLLAARGAALVLVVFLLSRVFDAVLGFTERYSGLVGLAAGLLAGFGFTVAPARWWRGLESRLGDWLIARRLKRLDGMAS